MPKMNDHPILNCAPQAPPGRAFQRWLLIPAHAWKVIVVSSDYDRLDVFEKVVLNLMRSGDYNVEQLSGFTHLHPDLVTILLERLHGDGLLKRTGDGQYRGLGPIRGDARPGEESGTQTVGWIFQQPWTGRLFPAFYQGLPFQPTSGTAGSADGRKLAFGDEADPFQIWAQYLEFPALTAINPTPRDVIRMIGLRQSEEFRERLSALRPIERHPSQKARGDDPDSVKRVKFLSAEPAPVYLATAGLVFDSEPGDWHVCCPAGTGLSKELRDQILRSAKEGDAGAQRIITQLGEKTRHGSIYAWENAHHDLLAHARRETLHTFGYAIANYPALLEQLDAFHDFWARIRGTDGEPPQHLVAPVFAAARKTLESLVKEFANQRPFTGLHAHLASKDETENTGAVMNWLRQSGFATDGVDGLFLVNKNWLIKSAGDSANYYMLKNVIGAIALQAMEQEDHPLRISAETYPEFFVDLKRLLALGNTASHDNSHGPPANGRLTKDAALAIRRPLAGIVRALLDPNGTIFNQD